MTKPAKTFLIVRFGVLLAVGLLGALLISIVVSNLPRRQRGRARTGEIVNNLRQLDGAVSVWAMEQHQTGAVMMTKEDIAPYVKHLLDRDGWVKSVAGELYILKPLPESPEAVLTREVEGRPKGTVFRFRTNGDLQLQIIPPNHAASNAALPHR
jgi:hypothetical protein